jgi:ComF family protein
MHTKRLQSFLHLFFPHNCEGCGMGLFDEKRFLCSRCIHQLPETKFVSLRGNPVEKLFYGRMHLTHAMAAYYFTKNSLLQHLMIQLKYRNNREAGYFLGRMMGIALANEPAFAGVDLLVPLPLNPKKEFKRGYNQAALICEGINVVWNKPVIHDAVERTRFTETQTKQNRISRWQNMEGVFNATDPQLLHNKHILLVDDVITTGATLEACGQAILAVEGTRLSIAAAAYTV